MAVRNIFVPFLLHSFTGKNGEIFCGISGRGKKGGTEILWDINAFKAFREIVPRNDGEICLYKLPSNAKYSN